MKYDRFINLNILGKWGQAIWKFRQEKGKRVSYLEIEYPSLLIDTKDNQWKYNQHSSNCPRQNWWYDLSNFGSRWKWEIICLNFFNYWEASITIISLISITKMSYLLHVKYYLQQKILRTSKIIIFKEHEWFLTLFLFLDKQTLNIRRKIVMTH